MKHYTHLTQAQRYQISALLQAKTSLSEIARIIGCHKSTVSCIDMLKNENTLSITFDNGKEFASHQIMAVELNTDIYFAQPYHSWERGTNENTNGLIQQFLPKSVRLDNLNPDLVQSIEDNLNSRPRKVLGYKTPLEVKSSFGCVALPS